MMLGYFNQSLVENMDLFVYQLKNLCHECLYFKNCSENNTASFYDSMKQSDTPNFTKIPKPSLEATQFNIPPKKRKNNESDSDENDKISIEPSHNNAANNVEMATSRTQWLIPISDDPINVTKKQMFSNTTGSCLDENLPLECANKEEKLPMILNSYSISSKPAFEALTEDVPLITDAFSLKEKASLQRKIVIFEEVENGINIDDVLFMLR